MRNHFYCLLLAALVLPLNGFASDLAVVDASSLNVREQPNGTLVTRLARDSIVKIVDQQGDWAFVEFIADPIQGLVSYGWVSRVYLADISQSDDEANDAFAQQHCKALNDSEVCVLVGNIDLECSDLYDGDYFDNCTISTDYGVTSSMSTDQPLIAEVQCTADIRYKQNFTNTWMLAAKSNYRLHDVKGLHSEANSMRLNFSFAPDEDVTSLAISSASCQVISVALR